MEREGCRVVRVNFVFGMGGLGEERYFFFWEEVVEEVERGRWNMELE